MRVKKNIGIIKKDFNRVVWESVIIYCEKDIILRKLILFLEKLYFIFCYFVICKEKNYF